MRKVWRRWGMIVRVMEKVVATVWDQDMMYKAVAQ